MVVLIRVVRVLLTLSLAVLVLSLIIGVARPETGVVEKVVLIPLIVGCFWLGAKLSVWSTKAQARLRRL
jgi:hypothetical protein